MKHPCKTCGGGLKVIDTRPTFVLINGERSHATRRRLACIENPDDHRFTTIELYAEDLNSNLDELTSGPTPLALTDLEAILGRELVTALRRRLDWRQPRPT